MGNVWGLSFRDSGFGFGVWGISSADVQSSMPGASSFQSHLTKMFRSAQPQQLAYSKTLKGLLEEPL